VEFVVDKVALGQVFSEYFGFPTNLHSGRTMALGSIQPLTEMSTSNLKKRIK
jgi:hypothetical protein